MMIAPLLLALLSASPDSCEWSRRESEKSEDGRYVVTIWRDLKSKSRVWNVSWEDTKEKKTTKGTLPGIEVHAHPRVFLTSDGTRFAILDSYAGRRMDNRLLILSAECKLVKSFGVADIVGKKGVGAVWWFGSHISWLWYHDIKMSENGVDLELVTHEGEVFNFHPKKKKILVSLKKAKVLKD